MPLAGHDMDAVSAFNGVAISTPMPLAGHDAAGAIYHTLPGNFYSHAPRGA